MGILTIIVIDVVAILALSILALWIYHKQTKRDTNNKNSRPKENYIDSLNPPSNFSPELRDRLKKISEFSGTRYVTQSDIQKHILYNISEDFLAMPGWSIWDSSIHEADGQFKRMERAATDPDISIISYDPRYRLAKVQGKTAVYLTSCNRCSCPDYRKRRLPCKHMYALAMELDGNVDKCILNSKHAPLFGLTLALAGRLPKSRNGAGGIRAEITALGGKWSDNIEIESSAVVMGNTPSAARVNRAKDFDMEILTPESIKYIFASAYDGENESK